MFGFQKYNFIGKKIKLSFKNYLSTNNIFSVYLVQIINSSFYQILSYFWAIYKLKLKISKLDESFI